MLIGHAGWGNTHHRFCSEKHIYELLERGCVNSIGIVCPTCGGDGCVTKAVNCEHGKSEVHYHCIHGESYGASSHP